MARIVAVEEQPDLNTFLVGLSADDTGEGEHLILQRALSFSDQDRRLGMATYCIVAASGTAYGGIVSCTLRDKTLEIDLNRATAKQLGVNGFNIEIAADEAAIRSVRAGLQRVFPQNDRPAQFDV